MTADEAAYGDRYIAFLDLLGFSALVRRADDPDVRALIQQLVRCLQHIPATVRQIQFTQFSDCVVLSSERSHGGLMAILFASRLISECVMLEGCLVRGGIASGKLTHTSKLVFGPGLLNAYGHDARGAPPRVVIAPDVVTEVGNESEFMRMNVRSDPADATPYLHSLLAVEYYDLSDDPVPFPAAIWNMPEIIGRMCGSLNVPEGVRTKWTWFRRYWNETVGIRQGLLSRGGAEVKEESGK